MSTKLPETREYITVIGESPAYKREVYQVKNKATGVIEYEHPTYPIIYNTIHEMQGMLDAVLNEDDGDPEIHNSDNVTQFRPH